MQNEVAIVGIGMVPFGRHPALAGNQLGAQALRAALEDSGLTWNDVGAAYGGSMEAGNADAIATHVGLTGLPFTNIFNGCATGGASLASAVASIRSGMTDVAVAVGFDKHARGAFNLQPAQWGLPQWYGDTGLMLTSQTQALKVQRYMYEHGISEDALARVAEMSFHNGSITPTAWRRQPLHRDEIIASQMVSAPLRKYMFCNPADGAAAIVVCSAERAARLPVQPVFIRAIALRTRLHGAIVGIAPSLAPRQPVTPTVMASRAAFEQAGVAPEDVDVAQLQDTESGSLIINMAENGFCDHGEQEMLIRDGAFSLQGRMPVNTDGGCMANGEPVGATGLRQIHEICVQLRGKAGERQVSGHPRIGYTHVYGAPGVSAVTILERHS
jgi:acetyl-CoA C-acetyltransferase